MGVSTAITTAPAITAIRAAIHSRWVAAQASARFQVSSGPIGSSSRQAAIRGAKVRLKNGGPTEIGWPVRA